MIGGLLMAVGLLGGAFTRNIYQIYVTGTLTGKTDILRKCL